MELFVSRKEHDLLFDLNPLVLTALFELPHSWSLGGVTFLNVPPEVVDEVNQTIA
jgi:hypothetical protein